jgi:aldehyde dehydrogenase (NAD+)
MHFHLNREKPLALYVFSNDNNHYNEFLERTSSGSYAFNDCIIQCALECIPFGGVGESGMGSYHGKFSVEAFSHRRAVLKGAFFGESLMGYGFGFYKLQNTFVKKFTLFFFDFLLDFVIHHTLNPKQSK